MEWRQSWRPWLRLFVTAAVVAVITQEGCVCGGDVTYDGRSLIIKGERRILFSGSIHYPRSTPEVIVSLHIYLFIMQYSKVTTQL